MRPPPALDAVRLVQQMRRSHGQTEVASLPTRKPPNQPYPLPHRQACL